MACRWNGRWRSNTGGTAIDLWLIFVNYVFQYLERKTHQHLLFGIWRCWFCGGRKTREFGQNPVSEARTNKKLGPFTALCQNRIRVTLVGGKNSHHCATATLQISWNTERVNNSHWRVGLPYNSTCFFRRSVSWGAARKTAGERGASTSVQGATNLPCFSLAVFRAMPEHTDNHNTLGFVAQGLKKDEWERQDVITLHSHSLFVKL